ncbi:L-aspartate oxidase [Pseudochelatococcus contaminans]|uniref:L-aspartate oxidase n=1 Tax=Pseudochelatococcus contaminans TaxID=1538103 RepID=A0A7W5Z4Z4_9HYPH|nr:L-aspartate oxidase [Pseudochelatococcus contaminans]MBB3810178.1 L-aspartate oxidase [Pseudochelatococcus contaminans]
MHNADRVIVVGAGIAGLATALRLAPLPVTLIAGKPLGEGAATALAQGGIAAAIGQDDCAALHAEDTVAAGAGLSRPDVALRVAEAAAPAIDWLIGLSAPFDRNDRGELALGLEAAHCRRRIAHAGGDKTGLMVLQALIRAARAAPHIAIMENLRVIELLRDDSGQIAGIAATTANAEIARFPARALVLATGGIGGLYASTTNPPGAVGSGLALAARAGAVMRDMEFVQFHPTAIAAGAHPMPLATEALRGEGAILIDERGERFMQGIPGGELAPRDVVARAIHRQIAAGHSVSLDARISGLERRFPGVVALCHANGIDPTRHPIPVRPAAHYHMGGIAVNAAGASSVPGLWACGEVASTGLHGGNRLASNSLLEALAFARWIAEDIRSAPSRPASAPLRLSRRDGPGTSAFDALRALMDSTVGVERYAEGLTHVAGWLHQLATQGDDRAIVALMIATGALLREESRGGHYRTDFPHPAPGAMHSETTLDATLRIAADISEANTDLRVA